MLGMDDMAGSPGTIPAARSRRAALGLLALGTAALAACGTPGPARPASPSNAGRFPAAVRPALAAVAERAHLPILAPTSIAASPRLRVSVTCRAAARSYDVGIYLTTESLPPNSPAIEKPPNGGLADLVGSFGGERYGSEDAARTALGRPVRGFMAPAGASLRGEWLQPRAAAEAWTVGPGIAAALWRQDGWQVEVVGLPMSLIVPYARSLAAYLASHPLPAGPGAMLVVAAGDGDHTSLYWQRGRDVYRLGDYHSARAAVAMARSALRYIP